MPQTGVAMGMQSIPGSYSYPSASPSGSSGFPTLIDAYSRKFNLVVRQKVLLAQLKKLSTLDTLTLEDALRTVPYTTYLASISSQKIHPSSVTSGLEAVDLLLDRLASIYGYQFYREGVMAEVSELASKATAKVENHMKAIKIGPESEVAKPTPGTSSNASEKPNVPNEIVCHAGRSSRSRFLATRRQ